MTSDTKFIAGGSEVQREAVKPGDTVLFIQQERLEYRLKNPDAQPQPVLLGEKTDGKVTYVIKMELPFEYYGPSKQNQIIERESCLNNPEDTCVNGGNVDLYENSSAVYAHGDTIRRLQGVIVSHDGSVIAIKTSSGKVITVQTPSDILTDFNTKRSSNYNTIKVGVGDMLDVAYFENANDHATTLRPDKIQDVNFAIDFISKSDPIKKY